MPNAEIVEVQEFLRPIFKAGQLLGDLARENPNELTDDEYAIMNAAREGYLACQQGKTKSTPIPVVPIVAIMRELIEVCEVPWTAAEVKRVASLLVDTMNAKHVKFSEASIRCACACYLLGRG